MRILITGGNGMVGRNLREYPAAQTVEVIAPSHSELDLLDYREVRDYFLRTKPTVVIHAAGHVGGIQANVREPVRFLVDNLDMGRNVVLGAREAEIEQLINLGSSCMYPRNASNPLVEEQILQGELEPTNEGYALAKISVAKLCEYISREDDGLQYKTLIPCNLYGRWDKFDPRHSHLVPSVIHKLHTAKTAGTETVDIWGDGTARREFMYAGDLADCIWRAVFDYKNVPSRMNVGLGHDYTIDEYYEIAAEIVGYRGQFGHDLSKPAGMQRKLLDVSRQLAWGWKAKTNLREGLHATYRYYCETQALKK